MDYVARIEWRHVYRIMYGVWTGIEVGELRLSYDGGRYLDHHEGLVTSGPPVAACHWITIGDCRVDE